MSSPTAGFGNSERKNWYFFDARNGAFLRGVKGEDGQWTQSRHDWLSGHLANIEFDDVEAKNNIPAHEIIRVVLTGHDSNGEEMWLRIESHFPSVFATALVDQLAGITADDLLKLSAWPARDNDKITNCKVRIVRGATEIEADRESKKPGSDYPKGDEAKLAAIDRDTSLSKADKEFQRKRAMEDLSRARGAWTKALAKKHWAFEKMPRKAQGQQQGGGQATQPAGDNKIMVMGASFAFQAESWREQVDSAYADKAIGLILRRAGEKGVEGCIAGAIIYAITLETTAAARFQYDVSHLARQDYAACSKGELVTAAYVLQHGDPNAIQVTVRSHQATFAQRMATAAQAPTQPGLDEYDPFADDKATQAPTQPAATSQPGLDEYDPFADE